MASMRKKGLSELHKVSLAGVGVWRTAWVLSMLLFSLAGTWAQASKSSVSFFQTLEQRVYVGEYSSYFADDIRFMQLGYECSYPLFKLAQNYHLVNFGLGLDALCAFDGLGGAENGRPVNARMTPGGELNWCLRLYAPPIGRSRVQLYLEGLGMTGVAYLRPFPEGGTNFNIGSHAGIGIEYTIGESRAFASVRLFHSSNGTAYETNPALNAIGLLAGVALK
jgi:hypothetical protein